MFRFFKKKPKGKETSKILDLNGTPIAPGARVRCLRYELGECTVEMQDKEYFYVSESSGKRISYSRMFDAATGNQKVLLIEEVK